MNSQMIKGKEEVIKVEKILPKAPQYHIHQLTPTEIYITAILSDTENSTQDQKYMALRVSQSNSQNMWEIKVLNNQRVLYTEERSQKRREGIFGGRKAIVNHNFLTDYEVEESEQCKLYSSLGDYALPLNDFSKIIYAYGGENKIFQMGKKVPLWEFSPETYKRKAICNLTKLGEDKIICNLSNSSLSILNAEVYVPEFAVERKSETIFSKSLPFSAQGNCFVASMFNNRENSSRLRVYDCRHKDCVMVLDDSESIVAEKPSWFPYHHLLCMLSPWQFCTVWGNSGKSSGSIFWLDSRYPLRKMRMETMREKQATLIEHPKEISSFNGSQIWVIQNEFSKYTFMGNKIKRISVNQ